MRWGIFSNSQLLRKLGEMTVKRLLIFENLFAILKIFQDREPPVRGSLIGEFWKTLKTLTIATTGRFFSAADVEFKLVSSLVVKLIEILFERCLNRNSICLTSNLAQNMSEKFRHFIRYSTRNFKSTSIVLCACLIWNLFECWWLVENFQ